MNWLLTICVSEQQVVGNVQKYVVVTVKNHENTQKPHLFDKISDYWYLQKGGLFLYMCGKNCIQNLNILSAPAP